MKVFEAGLALFLVVLVAGCLGAPDQSTAVPSTSALLALELNGLRDSVPSRVIALSFGPDETMTRIESAVQAYNDAIAGLVSVEAEAVAFHEHAARFRALTSSLADEKDRLVDVLEAAKHDQGVFPTWRELDLAKSTVLDHHQSLLDTAGRDLQLIFAARAAEMDAERRALATQMALYGLPAVPVVAAAAWAITFRWERKQRYWGSFTSRTLFLDPRLPMVVLAVLGIAAGVSFLTIFPETRSLVSFLLPW